MSALNPVPAALADCISDWWRRVKPSSGDCRMVVPAPTLKVALGLHSILLERGLTSYLVCSGRDGAVAPSEERKILRAEAVTSVRDGSFIAVVEPGVLSKLQESIQGSGGGIRSLTIPDEWPWAPADAGFDFFLDFLPRWVTASGFPDAELETARELLLLAIEATEPMKRRAELLFDEILADSFDGILTSEERADAFAMRVGVPSLNGPSILEVGVPAAGRKELRLLESLVASMEEASAREAIEQNAEAALEELPPGDRPDVQDFKGLLNRILDQMRTGREHGRGALGLRDALPKDRRSWRQVTVSALRRVFNYQPTSLPVTVTASWRFSDGSGLTLGSGRHGVSSRAPMPSVVVEVERPEELEARVELKVGRKSLGEWVFAPGDRKCELNPDWSKVAEGSLALTLTAVAGALPRATTRLFLERPVSTSGFVLVATLSKDLTEIKELRRVDQAEGDEQEESVDIDSSTEVYVVSPTGSLLAKLDGTEVEQECLSGGVLRLSIDHSQLAAASSPPELLVEGTGTSISVQLVAGLRRSGPCNLERALLQSLQHGSSTGRGESLLKAWLREFDARPLLGSPDEGQQMRFQLASAFERASDPSLPIVLSQPLEVPGSLSKLGICRVPSGQSTPLGGVLGTTEEWSPDVRRLLDAYEEARAGLLHVIQAGHGGNSRIGLPLYALASFDYEDGDALSGCAISYLRRFAAIQEALAEGKFTYGERFLLAFLDSVVCVAGRVSWTVVGAALGPWHPLVVAKRMLVGRGIRRLASLTRPEERWLRRLGVLLEGRAGFRWFPGLGADSSHLVPYYADATDDPGWVLLSPVDSSGSIQEEVGITWERRMLGLTGLRRGGEATGLGGYLADYFRAFPSKRSIVVKISGEETGSEAAAAAREFMTTDGKPTPCGQALRGGIHVVIDGEGGTDEDYPEWQSPVVCVYPKGGKGFLSLHRIDMLLARPASMASFPLQSDQEARFLAPRGNGSASVLQLPLRTLDASGSGVSDSRLSYNTLASDGDDLGSAFIGAVAGAQAAAGPGRSVAVRTLSPDSNHHDAVWTVLPGDGADPAVLLDWARSSSQSGTPKVLWDYRLAIAQSARSYYVLSEVPASLVHHLSTSEVFCDQARAGAALLELAGIGLALGSEAFKSRARALGVVGLVGAARVAQEVLDAACAGEEGTSAFVLPIDSFRDLLGGDLDGGLDDDVSDYRRGDLIGVVCRESDGVIELAFCSVESKYCGKTYSEARARRALEQAARSLCRLVSISQAASKVDALAERVALAQFLEFGLRLDASRDTESISRVLAAVLRGEHRTSILGRSGCMVVSTEIASSESAVHELEEGLWVRLSPAQWPKEAGDFRPIADRLACLKLPPWRARAHAALGIVGVEGGSPVITSCQQDCRAAVGSLSGPAMGLHERQMQAVGGEVGIEARSGDQPVRTATPMRLLLGVSNTGVPVIWQAGENSNHNFMVTGSSGLGKTQLLKSILLQARQQGLPVLILDFKNDFASDREFLVAAGLDVQYVSFDGLPYNPLIPCPQPDPRTGEPTYPVSQHITGIVSTFQRTYGLGEQQAAALKDAIRGAFESVGIPSSGVAREILGQFPDFALVGEQLRESNKAAYNRLDPLFDLEIFRDNYRDAPFNELLGRGYVLDLSGIQADHIQNTLAMLLVHSAHRYLNALPHAATVKQLLVFDEAHRILRSEDVERLVRECRAYGLGVLLSSQYPTDFPADTAANLATKVLHGNGPDVTRVQAIRSTLGLAPDMDAQLNLGIFHAAMLARPGGVVLGRTIGYPHQLVLGAVRKGLHSVSELRMLPGLHEGKFDAALEHLSQCGLVRVNGDEVSLVGQSG